MAENNHLLDNSLRLGMSRRFRHTTQWSFQQLGLRTSQLQQMATDAPRILREDLNHVFLGLSPLVSGPGNNVPWLRQDVNANSSPVQNSLPIPPRASNDSDFVINLEESGRQNTNEGSPQDVPSVATEQVVGELPNRPPQPTDVLNSSPELRALVSVAEKYVPFLLILLMKIVFDHRIGILIILGLFLTFCHANAVVKREVGKQSKRQLSSLGFVTVNLCTCIGFVYFVLAEDSLAYALILISPYSSAVTVWEVLWITTVTDFVLKLLTVLTKIFITSLPGQVIPFKKKGKYFLFNETASQLYRTLAPMQHWLYYFSESYHGSSKIFGVILSAAYLVAKCKDIIAKTQNFRRAFNCLLQSVNYGVIPNADQLKIAGEACPICQDDYRTPTMLHCKHIFCEECVSIWFDRERTCPMCRAQIGDDPTWRDGSTTFIMQIF